ncbi:DUF4336 domain-containing protein [Sphingomonas sp. ac-8]|uniref:DUF4336 domain-containing protein n=1 Tax=Sphingomonas sp. ac-8 TaxID=3242977 RepID=UPI003A80959D
MDEPRRQEEAERPRRTGQGVAIGAGLALGIGSLALAYRRSRRSGHAHDAQDVTYPPLDTPKPLAEDLWIVDSGPIVAAGLALPVRMTVVRLSGGNLLLHSPTRYTPALAEALAGFGRIRHLVAPSIAHWTFLQAWQQAFPDAASWGVPGLRDRAQVRRAGVRIDRDLGEMAPDAWAADLAQGIVPGGLGFREAYFFHKPSRTLLLVDLIENLQSDKQPPLVRWVLGAARATSGTTALYLRAALWLGGAAMVAKVRELVALEPDRVIVAHGGLFTEQAPRRLREAFAWVLAGTRASETVR